MLVDKGSDIILQRAQRLLCQLHTYLTERPACKLQESCVQVAFLPCLVSHGLS